ncbi:MAG: hypothetical protein WB421_13980, partial [Terriglobales bacterium]
GIVSFFFNEHTSKIAFVGNQIESLTILDDTDPLFGFDVGPVMNDPTNPTFFYGQNMAISKLPSYLLLCMREMQDEGYVNFLTSSSKGPRNVIARIQMNADVLHMVNSSSNTCDFSRPINFANPLNLSRLSLSFVGPEGESVDFQGVEHHLLLKVTSRTGRR